MSATGDESVVDVAVIGGGLAGLATSINLARRRRRVVCLEPRPWPRPAVGESLEFSAPGLLADLGINIADGDEQRHLFPKTSVRIIGDGAEFTVWPPVWFARPPIWCSRLAFHTDRSRLDQQVVQLAIDDGVEIVPERVTSVDHDHDVITALVTDRGTRVEARWFIDASGHTSRLFGRALDVDMDVLGAPRAAYWTRFAKPPDNHATRLYFPEASADDLAWAWEIPLNPDELSVGVVMSGTMLATLRHRGLQPREVFQRQLAAVPRLHGIALEHPDVKLHATAYTPYRHCRTLGPNWLLVGDAAAMVDPLTSNGVTSALRHADQAARAVSHALDQHELDRRHAWAYQHTATATVTTIAAAMEAFVYRPAVRQHLGLRWAVNLYAATGVITNSAYARIKPITVLRSVACAMMLASSRLWIRIASTTLTRLGQHKRGATPSPVNKTSPSSRRADAHHSSASPPHHLTQLRRLRRRTHREGGTLGGTRT